MRFILLLQAGTVDSKNLAAMHPAVAAALAKKESHFGKNNKQLGKAMPPPCGFPEGGSAAAKAGLKKAAEQKALGRLGVKLGSKGGDKKRKGGLPGKVYDSPSVPIADHRSLARPSVGSSND